MATGGKNQGRSSGTRKTSSRNNSNSIKNSKNSNQISLKAEIILICIIVVSILLFLSNFGIIGAIGDVVASFLYGVFGVMAYVFPLVLLIGSVFAVSNRKNKPALLKIVFGALLFVFICIFDSLASQGEITQSGIDAYIQGYAYHKGGGMIGAVFTNIMVPNVGLVGSYVITIAGVLISGILLTERSLYTFLHNRGKDVVDTSKVVAQKTKEHRAEVQANRAVKEYEKQEKLRRRDRKIEGVAIDTTIVPPTETSSDNMSELRINGVPAEDYSMPEIEPVSRVVSPCKVARSQEIANTGHSTLSRPEYETAMEDAPVHEEVPRRSRNPRQTAETIEQQTCEVAKEMGTQEQISNYTYPPVRLLTKGTGKRSGDSNQQLRETAAKLEQTLHTFGVRANVINVSCGPSVTRFEIQPELGVKVNKIVALADDIKLNLAAEDIRIEAPIPGKAAVGIEVPNKENVTVMLRDLIESEEFAAASTKIPFPAGKDIGGNIIISDIGKMPHVLIAGSTGSGKSVCINTIIMSILYKARPDEVKLIMIDPKVVELSVYNGIPHLMIPVVTEPKKAAGALHWAVAEMTDRYKRFAEFGVRDIKGYNEQIKRRRDSGEEATPPTMPQIVIIVDELADLMMVAPGDVEDAICRLAQLARAAGIHLILATQRPSVNVITGLIKANMPSRVAFAVSSGVDSRTILDMNGAEKLLGKGDMLFAPQGYPKPLRVQGAFVSDKEVADVVEFLKKECPSTGFDASIEEKVSAMSSGGHEAGGIDGGGIDDGRDALFYDAGKFIIEKERGSIGMLQRAFRIGFNRAARIMDQLFDAGVVGPEEGTKPRKILMTIDEFEGLFIED